MPSRLLRDAILTSQRVDQLDEAQEVFYRRLMSVVDDYGRYDGRPAILRSACYPLRSHLVKDENICAHVQACVVAGLVQTYEVDGKPYLCLLNLGSPRAKNSKYPDPPGESENIRKQMRADVPYSGSGSGSGSGSERLSTASAVPAEADTPAAISPVFLTFATVGGKTNKAKTWELREDLIAEMTEAYPQLDVRAECRKALLWTRLRPANRKTPDGMRPFLFGWLSRAQNRGGTNSPRPTGQERNDAACEAAYAELEAERAAGRNGKR